MGFKMKAEVARREVAEYGGLLMVLEAPICARVGDAVGVCRQNKNKEWAFVGGGVIRSVNVSEREEEKAESVSVGVTSQTAQSALSRTETESVHIRYTQRNGRKGVTTIVGLPQTIEFKPLATRMKKKWSTNATVFEDAQMGTIIQLQGDRRKEVGLFVVEEGFVLKAQVRVHGY